MTRHRLFQFFLRTLKLPRPSKPLVKEQGPQPRKLSRLCAGVGLDSFLEALGKENSFLQGWPAATAALTNSSGARGIPQAASTVEAETSELVLEAEAPRTFSPLFSRCPGSNAKKLGTLRQGPQRALHMGQQRHGRLEPLHDTDRPVALAGCEHDLLMLRHK